MPAFLLHKLLVALERKPKAKQEKDLVQAWEVARVIARSPGLARSTKRHIQKEIHPRWLRRIRKKSLALLAQLPVATSDERKAVLARLGLPAVK
ncbi:MAG: hypothetical protein AB1512_29665 [Thermodesulfobacteriota bacterium]